MYVSIDVLWTIIAALLIFFMQAGFTLLEVGFTRAKNATNSVMKNVTGFALGSLFYWFIGFGIMFGTQNAFFGGVQFFASNQLVFDLPSPVVLLFQTVLCTTAITIVSGATAERMSFKAYCLCSAVMAILIYPVSGHWIFGNGFLSEWGFHDFAGGTAVHMVGGVAALVGAALLGPRIGKYTSKGESQAIPGHNLTFAALGTFILWVGWFGFIGGMSHSLTGDDMLLKVSQLLLNTNLAAITGTLAVILLSWFKYGKPDVSLTLNGTLAGLVGITAGADIVSPFGAVLIGGLSGVVMLLSVEWIDQKLLIDDPVGVIAVHGVCGALGTLLVGLFASEGGLFYGGGFSLLGLQVLGVLITSIWVALMTWLLLLAIKHTVGLRVTAEAERIGLDTEEHGLVTAYSGFYLLPDTTLPIEVNQVVDLSEVPFSEPERTKREPQSFSEGKLTTISVIINEKNLDKLKSALDQIGIQGITVTSVMGHGIQRGQTEIYRGAAVPTKLLPKLKVEVTVSQIPVAKVVNTIKSVLYSGHPGDGKIFVTNVENVIRISNGDEGYDALQGYDR